VKNKNVVERALKLVGGYQVLSGNVTIFLGELNDA
jgi:hypothetical protein